MSLRAEFTERVNLPFDEEIATAAKHVLSLPKGTLDRNPAVLWRGNDTSFEM